MAKRDFDEYYTKIRNLYFELLNVLETMQLYCTDNIVSPEVVDLLLTTIDPVKAQYESIAYTKYLLDLPAKKEKKPRFKNLNRLLWKNNPNTLENKLSTGESALSKLKELSK